MVEEKEENKRQLQKAQDVEMTAMDERGVKVNTSSPKTTVSAEPNTLRSFAELSPATSLGITIKVAPKKRSSGTATALSSTCKTASGQPGLVDQVTPYHAELENSHGGRHENV